MPACRNFCSENKPLHLKNTKNGILTVCQASEEAFRALVGIFHVPEDLYPFVEDALLCAADFSRGSVDFSRSGEGFFHSLEAPNESTEDLFRSSEDALDILNEMQKPP
jgi:hypothetical protein